MSSHNMQGLFRLMISLPCFIVFALIAGTTPTWANIVIANDSFETPSTGGGHQYAPAHASWTFVPLKSMGNVASGSGIAASPEHGFGFNGPPTQSGSQVAFVQGFGTITQTVSGFQSGGSYVITFNAAQRSYPGNPQNQLLDVRVDGNSLGVFYPGASFSQFRTALFSVTAGNHIIQLAGINTRDESALVDLVTVVAVNSVTQPWTRTWNGPFKVNDAADKVTLDPSGNPIVVGYSDNQTACRTVKYASNGTEIWNRRFGGVNDAGDNLTSVATDSAGNIYVTGYTTAIGFASDFVTIKYDPNGTMLWYHHYDGPGHGTDLATAIGVDASGNVYVAGVSYGGSATGDDMAVIKYDNNGRIKWVQRFNGTASQGDGVNAMAVDSSGNVYVSGYSFNDFATVAYDTNGNRRWAALDTVGGPANAIALDNLGNIYVTGYASLFGPTDDYYTAKYSPAGSKLWAHSWDGPRDDDDAATAIAVDASGNVFVTGGSPYFVSDIGDYATLKYDVNGNLLWSRLYDGPAGGHDQANAIALDGSGNVYVTGNSAQIFGTFGAISDIATLKYDTNGNQKWVKRFDNPANGDDQAFSIAVDSVNNVYIAGSSYNRATGIDMRLIKYAQ